MVLRASAEAQGTPVDLRGVLDPGVSTGLPHGDVLVGFADALLGSDDTRLGDAREALVRALGVDALVASSVIAANFSRNDRIANATGIPLEGEFVKQSDDFRAALGIDAFTSALNTLGEAAEAGAQGR